MRTEERQPTATAEQILGEIRDFCRTTQTAESTFGRRAVNDGKLAQRPFGAAGSPRTTEQMLENMFVGRPPGNYDRILDFSTAVTGINFFVPTADFLDDPPDLPTRLVPEATFTAPISDGSLGIGSLKRSAQQ